MELEEYMRELGVSQEIITRFKDEKVSECFRYRSKSVNNIHITGGLICL
jgi:hypothetical protein